MPFPATIYLTQDADDDGLFLPYVGLDELENNDAVGVYRLIDTGYASVETTREYVSDKTQLR